MNSEDVSKKENPLQKARTLWGYVNWWIGLYLTRLIVGSVLWLVFSSQVWNFVTDRMQREIVVLGDAHGLFTTLAIGLPLAALLSVVLLPYGRAKEKIAMRGNPATVAAVRSLLPFAVVLQVAAAASENAWLTFLNFVVVSGVVFLATIALDLRFARQFPLLILGALHGISSLITVFIPALDPTVDRIEIKVASWMGSVLPLILMTLLFVMCIRRLRNRNSLAGNHPGSYCPALPINEVATVVEGTSGTVSAPVAETKDQSAKRFFYVGPNNEPIGPISSAVLFQLRRSGAVTDLTFVAHEGESDWVALGDRIIE